MDRQTCRADLYYFCALRKREEMSARELVSRWQVSVLLHPVSSISQSSEAVIGAVRHTHSCPSAYTLRAESRRGLGGEFTATSWDRQRRVWGGKGGARGNSRRQKQRGNGTKEREWTRRGPLYSQRPLHVVERDGGELTKLCECMWQREIM